MNNKISVLSKMANSAKEGGDSKYVVPANSEANVSAVGIEHKQHHRQVGTATTAAAAHQCPNCENMAKNFLYLESLLRENSANKKQCAQCKSLSKYLQHINRNIMQTFSNFEAVIKSFKGSLKGKGDALGSPKLKKKAKKSTKNRNDEITIMTTTLGGSKRRLAGGDNKVSELKISTAVYKKKNAKSASKKAASKKSASTKGSALSRKRKTKKDDEKSTTSATDKKPKTKPATKKTKSKSAADKTDKPKLPKTKASSSKKNKKSKSIDKKVKNTVRDITKRVLGLA